MATVIQLDVRIIGSRCFLAMQVEGSVQNRVNNESNLLEGEAVSTSSNPRELFYWVNDYKCSICGIEMPLDFVEERQEHSDFHLAEKLQKEESGTNFGSAILRQRYFIFKF